MPKIFKFSPMWWNFDKFGHTNRYHYQIVSFFYFLFIIKLTYFIDCYSITISTLKSLRQSCVNRYSFVQYDTYFTNFNDHVETAFLFILPTNIPNHLLTYLPLFRNSLQQWKDVGACIGQQYLLIPRYSLVWHFFGLGIGGEDHLSYEKTLIMHWHECNM